MLIGQSFTYKRNTFHLNFTVIKDWFSSVLVRINDSVQSIWIPKTSLKISDGKIIGHSLDWIINNPEFLYKLSLIKKED